MAVLSGFEFWRGRDERLLSRWPVIVLFGTLSLFFVSRILFIHILPFPLGARPLQSEAVAVFNMVVFFHALVLTVLFVALSKERLEREQRNHAQTDPLTGALNRRALMYRGARMLTRHQFENAPLCLLFLDLDHFKALNDRFGHSGGDDMLTKFVAVVHDSIRPSDSYPPWRRRVRCLLPHTDTAQARTVAERIRQQSRATASVAGAVVKTTVSLGIASTETFGYDLDTLMRRADTAVMPPSAHGPQPGGGRGGSRRGECRPDYGGQRCGGRTRTTGQGLTTGHQGISLLLRRNGRDQSTPSRGRALRSTRR